MSVSHLEVTRRTPFAHDYERVDGIMHFAVEPSHPANQRIVDLDRAARDTDGRVHFSSDFVLLQPRDAQRANRRLLFYVVNRGQRFGVPFNRVPARDVRLPPTDEIDPGDGFLMRHGWTVAMCGWQWDVRRVPGLTGLDAPQALGPDGNAIPGRINVAFQPNEAHSFHLLSHWPLHPPPGKIALSHQPYPAADVNEATAELTVRDSMNGPRTAIPRARWRFAREVDGQLVADDSYVWLADGFQPGQWYEVSYTTRISPVVGTGMLAVRDCVAWLHHDLSAENPAAGRIDFTYGYGISQCGRFLRQYLYDGMNLDEAGRQVFDGLNPHVAGARRGEFNQRYGQPSETNPHGSGGLPPFDSDGLLARQRELGGLPRIFTTNTSSEYWRSDCSLIHTDASGSRDVEPPPEERLYLIAGHRHGPGDALLIDTNPAGARTANALTVVDGSTVFRALLVRLDEWVSHGVEPPPNAFPRLADGTAVSREAILAQMRALPGLVSLDPALMPTLRKRDDDTPYPSYAAAVDADGNELAGIRLPDLSVPVATHTGWVARHPETGAPGQLVDMMGFTLPFPPTSAARAETGDPRPAIAERYRDRDAYV
ncbi:MAG TPA: alpha/beta hydrolase domain-containing protein, partial [Chloroflexota bacterium]|nr:alpha/beta hydrolase domain-containing protein [Chloroflexota bacterium]